MPQTDFTVFASLALFLTAVIIFIFCISSKSLPANTKLPTGSALYNLIPNLLKRLSSVTIAWQDTVRN